MRGALMAEFAGTALLLAIVVGSGIMAENLAAGNNAIALLANSLATGAGLYVLISVFAPISGAHFNPVVSMAEFGMGEMPANRLVSYVTVQVFGGIIGVWIAHAMFAMPLLQASLKIHTGPAQWFSEIVATAVLLGTIRLGIKFANDRIALLVALIVTAGYWFTASTFFGNPAVTIARSMTNTFAGIRLADTAGFVMAQLMAVILVVGMERYLACKYCVGRNEN